MKRFISRLLLAASVAAAVMSCDNKNNGTTITLSPGENQQRLEDVGNRLISKFRPEVQKTLIEAVDDFINYAYEGDLEVLDKYADNVAGNLASVIKSAVAEYNFNSVTTLAEPGKSLYDAARVYGIYTYDGTSWEGKNLRTSSNSGSILKMERRWSLRCRLQKEVLNFPLKEIRMSSRRMPLPMFPLTAKQNVQSP